MAKLLSLLSRFVTLSLTAAAVAGCGALPAARKPEFAPGQVWSVKSAQPIPMKVVIGRIESWNGQVVVHVAVTDVLVPVGLPNAGETMVIDHMPFEQSALAASVSQLLATAVPLPGNFEEGYRDWQVAQGGIFTIGVAKAVASILDMLKEPPEHRADQLVLTSEYLQVSRC